MAIDRIVEVEELDEEQSAGAGSFVDTNNEILSLRPTSFAQYIGQPKLKKNLKLAIDAARGRSETIDHVLLYGPPGLGKTTMAGVIAKEMGATIHITAGPAIERAADLASLLTKLQPGDILFIDEVHSLGRALEEVLYTAMEDFSLDIVLGKGPSAKSLRIELPQFTLIGATTKTGALAAPLRDRFGLVHQLDFYSEPEIATILDQNAKLLNIKLNNDAGHEIAIRSRLTPRIANRILKRVRDYAQVHGHNQDLIDLETARKALDLLEIDSLGLDSGDRRILTVIHQMFKGGPVGLDTLAAATAEEKSTIEDYYEPYLMRIGLLERTPKGRKLTAKGMLLAAKITP